jgi:hypothetical protein
MPVTPNIGLNVPATNTSNWDVLLNANFTLLDLLLSGNQPLVNLALNGLISKYNGIPTVANGVPSILAAYDATAQSASIAPVTLFTPTVAGMYKVTTYIVVTQAGTASSSILATIGYTDNDSSVVESSTASAYTGNTVGGLFILTSNCYCQAGAEITLATTYASSGATAMNYAIHARMELLG